MATYVNGTATLSPATTSVGIRRLEQQLDVLVSNANFFIACDNEKDADSDWLGLVLCNVPKCSKARDSGIFYEGRTADGDFLKIYYRGRNDDGIKFFTEICNLLGFDVVLSYVCEGESTSQTKTVLADESKFYPSALKELPGSENKSACDPVDSRYSSVVSSSLLHVKRPDSNWFISTYPEFCLKLLQAGSSTAIDAAVLDGFEKCYRDWDISVKDRASLGNNLFETVQKLIDSRDECGVGCGDPDLYPVFCEIRSTLLSWVPADMEARVGVDGSPEGFVCAVVKSCYSDIANSVYDGVTLYKILFILRAVSCILLKSADQKPEVYRKDSKDTHMRIESLSLDSASAAAITRSSSRTSLLQSVDFITCSDSDIDQIFMCGCQLPQPMQIDGLDSVVSEANKFYSVYKSMCTVNPSGEYTTKMLYIFDLFRSMYTSLVCVNDFLQNWRANNTEIIDSVDYFTGAFSILDDTPVFSYLDITLTCSTVLFYYSQLTDNVAGLLERIMRAESHILSALAPVSIYLPGA